jgi:hypothetical protein
MIRRYVQRRWGVKLTRLLWGTPAEPAREYEFVSRKPCWTLEGHKGETAGQWRIIGPSCTKR